ncbi:hypothetical protein XELAEV_18008814mg [Xenopus laevis]|uniref:Uncharacterized protein n=1 Tax=Xenopus laevis TaxID=8355 RepID=A0A974DRG7_XENLA|nr:hypothetical protein XELAEV_18008814mg [Xenopus laevis]
MKDGICGFVACSTSCNLCCWDSFPWNITKVWVDALEPVASCFPCVSPLTPIGLQARPHFHWFGLFKGFLPAVGLGCVRHSLCTPYLLEPPLIS